MRFKISLNLNSSLFNIVGNSPVRRENSEHISSNPARALILAWDSSVWHFDALNTNFVTTGISFIREVEWEIDNKLISLRWYSLVPTRINVISHLFFNFESCSCLIISLCFFLTLAASWFIFHIFWKLYVMNSSKVTRIYTNVPTSILHVYYNDH